MSRTLKDIERDLTLAKEELEPIQKARDAAVKKVNEFYHEREKYKLDNGMYHPISELSNYIGKNVSYIHLVERDENGELDTERIWGDEYFEVDKNGHLDYSSESGGVMSFDEKIGKYVMWYHYCKTEHDYVGFLELTLEDEGDDEEE